MPSACLALACGRPSSLLAGRPGTGRGTEPRAVLRSVDGSLPRGLPCWSGGVCPAPVSLPVAEVPAVPRAREQEGCQAPASCSQTCQERDLATSQAPSPCVGAQAGPGAAGIWPARPAHHLLLAAHWNFRRSLPTSVADLDMTSDVLDSPGPSHLQIKKFTIFKANTLRTSNKIVLG